LTKSQTVKRLGTFLRHGVLVSPVLSVTSVYCVQTLEWIKMPLSMEVSLGPGHIVLDGDPAP